MHLECRTVSATSRSGGAICSALDGDGDSDGVSKSRRKEGSVCRVRWYKKDGKGEEAGV